MPDKIKWASEYRLYQYQTDCLDLIGDYPIHKGDFVVQHLDSQGCWRNCAGPWGPQYEDHARKQLRVLQNEFE